MSLNIRPESNTLGNFYHRYVGTSPITIGGLKIDNSDGTNELTFLFIEAAELSRAVTNIALRVSKNTPDELLITAAEILYKGSSNIAFFNDEINIEAMKRRNFLKALCSAAVFGLSGICLLSRKIGRVFVRAPGLGRYPGKVKKISKIDIPGRWKG